MEDVDLLHKLQLILPRTFFLTIYRLFIRPHLDCGNVFTVGPLDVHPVRNCMKS